MKPSEKYIQFVEQSGYETDRNQIQAMHLLDDLVEQLSLKREAENPSWLQRLVGKKTSNNVTRGIYFWGGVGRGKTFVMDIFYRCLQDTRKSRRHFHGFMNDVHKSLKQKAGLENPLKAIGQDIAAEIDVLCLDEFVVTDIGDAMILSGLLEALFERGVVLVTTSNSPPQDLYRDGLQRARFLPAIDLISSYCRVVNLDSGKDYRLQGLQQTHLYSVPHSEAADQEIRRYLDEHLALRRTEQKSLNVNGRDIPVVVCVEDTIWFSFSSLCKTNRSQTDYLEIARMFNTLIVTDIEVMSSLQDDIARRFVLLIDVMYDHRVKLICTAAADAENLYEGKRLSFEFERTSSRLIEMQSQHYLSEAHTQQ